MEFCVGCGRDVLRRSPLGNDYESPCTRYRGESREFIIRELKDLKPDKLNRVLEFYGHELLPVTMSASDLDEIKHLLKDAINEIYDCGGDMYPLWSFNARAAAKIERAMSLIEKVEQ